MSTRVWWQLRKAATDGTLGDVERLLGEGAEVNSADKVKTCRGCGCFGEGMWGCAQLVLGGVIYRGDDGP